VDQAHDGFAAGAAVRFKEGFGVGYALLTQMGQLAPQGASLQLKLTQGLIDEGQITGHTSPLVRWGGKQERISLYFLTYLKDFNKFGCREEYQFWGTRDKEVASYRNKNYILLLHE
jgi:hypothetical protein